MTTDARTPVVRLERDALCDTLLAVGPDAPTLCDPWRTRDLAAHLVVRERRPDAAVGIWVPAFSGWTQHEQERIARGDWDELVATVRSGAPWWSPARIDRVESVFNTVELIVHHEDVLRGDGAVGPRREVPDRVARAAFHALRKAADLMFRRSPVGVTLVAPGREPLHAGPDDRSVTVSGEPVELLLLASGRARVAEVTMDGSPEDVATLRTAQLGMS
ncbi:TIGR03085 family metal-binding protein [Oryzobacter sp. R7]|uniref:TIGR03085 family metal-binding protein n=1 Tax=Oryzobacter faecalis TaxID=3388656 RepID=UPI00398CBCAB